MYYILIAVWVSLIVIVLSLEYKKFWEKIDALVTLIFDRYQTELLIIFPNLIIFFFRTRRHAHKNGRNYFFYARSCPFTACIRGYQWFERINDFFPLHKPVIFLLNIIFWKIQINWLNFACFFSRVSFINPLKISFWSSLSKIEIEFLINPRGRSFFNSSKPWENKIALIFVEKESFHYLLNHS